MTERERAQVQVDVANKRIDSLVRELAAVAAARNEAEHERDEARDMTMAVLKETISLLAALEAAKRERDKALAPLRAFRRPNGHWPGCSVPDGGGACTADCVAAREAVEPCDAGEKLERIEAAMDPAGMVHLAAWIPKAVVVIEAARDGDAGRLRTALAALDAMTYVKLP